MQKTRILLYTKKHILSIKLYEILKRDYDVKLFNMDDIKKNRVNQYTAAFYGVDHIVFTSEFIWELFCYVEKSITTKFLSMLFSIASTEKVKITYIEQYTLFEKEYMEMSNEDSFQFLRLKNYIKSAVETVETNLVIIVPSVYGISSEKDIVDMIKEEKFDIQTISSLNGPVLADKVAIYVSKSFGSNGIDVYPADNMKFIDWMRLNYTEEFEARSEEAIIRKHQEHCVFDLVYKREANSHYRNQSIAEERIKIGKKLAEVIPQTIKKRLDFVTPVPRTGLYYAMGLSEGLNIPYRQVIVKGTYSERSFSMTDIDDRKKFLWKKISLIPELIKGKRIAVVDEAIFTGTTLKVVCDMLWNCEADEIYLCIPTPPCRYHCNYLVHPPRKMLLEYMSIDYLKEYFNVTGLYFQNEQFFTDYNTRLDNDVCLECFYGENSYE